MSLSPCSSRYSYTGWDYRADKQAYIQPMANIGGIRNQARNTTNSWFAHTEARQREILQRSTWYEYSV